MDSTSHTGGSLKSNPAPLNEKTIAIIQARMGSTRLPGKVLLDIRGATMLARVVNRTRRASNLDQVVVATTTSPLDDEIVRECGRLDVAVFRGSDVDVLDRYFRAGAAYGAATVVRITCDCPLIDPNLIDKVVAAFRSQVCDYAANIIERTYPRGLDTEVVRFEALARAWHEAREPYQRAHVTPYILFQPQLFRLVSVREDHDYSRHRWTVDMQSDLDLVRAIYARFGDDDGFLWHDILSLLGREPGLAEINHHIEQKKLEQG